MTKRIVVVGLAAFVAGALGACSSSNSGGGTTPGGDGGTDAAPAPTGTLSILVGDGTVVAQNTNPPPVPGATVYFDPPGGGDRIQATAGPDGVAKLEGIDWSKGTGSLVVFAKGHQTTFLTNVSPDVLKTLPKLFPFDGAVLAVPVIPSISDDYVELKGNITNKADAKQVVVIGSSAGGTNFQGPQSSYSIRVPKGKAGSLFVTELLPGTPPAQLQTFTRFAKIDYPAPSGPATADIDLAAATAVPTTKSKRTYTLPGGAAGSMGGAQAYYVMSVDLSPVAYGGTLQQVLAQDGSSIALDVEVPTDPGGKDVVGLNFLQKNDGTVSTVLESGPPQDGAAISDFKDPPAVTIDSMKLSDVVTVDGVGDNGLVGLQFLDLDGVAILAGGVLGPQKAGSVQVTVPKLPPEALAQLGSTSMTARATVIFLGDTLPNSIRVHHFTASRQFAASK